jgi:hypothetical protein
MIVSDSDLAARIAPQLVAALQDRQAAILRAAGGPARRAALRIVWPLLINEVPQLAAAAIDAVRQQFGTMTLNDVLDWRGKRP